MQCPKGPALSLPKKRILQSTEDNALRRHYEPVQVAIVVRESAAHGNLPLPWFYRSHPGLQAAVWSILLLGMLALWLMSYAAAGIVLLLAALALPWQPKRPTDKAASD
ncbi:MAG TPA: hypothetical protein PKH24_07750 [Sedimentisphaerales bacterium]|nr:hypothetical protein [Sedimentisphaerales bacterium]HNU29158.1 hypothetical protein [Sedimentisphaerales bacterium]